MGLRVALPVFAVAFAADLLSKDWAVRNGHVLVYNAKPSELPKRLLMCVAAVAVAAALTRAGKWRGFGRVWGAWVGCALLVSGVLANGISPLLWSRGVPDFIDVHDGWVWNLADFQIALGMTGGMASVAVGACIVYLRESFARRRTA